MPVGSFARQVPGGGGGGAAVTVIDEVPIFVSLNAVIVALPAAIAVTSPEPETVLMPGLLELQAIVRPVSTLLLASRVVAESWTVAPTNKLDDDGETATVATGAGGGAVTVIVAPLLLPSLVAVT
jgi:hypothetical protein